MSLSRRATYRKKMPDVEIVYIHRSEWPIEIVRICHKLHMKNGTQNPRCPYCNGEKRWRA